ncbi:MAG: hypothetical protein HQ536_00780 [Parcubacteria group bacterium]|nr:hypothetical protein [Parcubacteria group bacterium]
MKRLILITTILLITVISGSAYAEKGRIIRLGAGAGMFADYSSANGGIRLSLHARAERFAPFELEMNYSLGGGFEFILLTDIIRSRYINWHFFDLGLYFPMGARQFNNEHIERSFDIVIGTGIDIDIPSFPGLIIFANLRFYIPDPGAILFNIRESGREDIRQISQDFDLNEALIDLNAYVEREYDHVVDGLEDEFTDVFRDIGRSVVLSVGIKYYF